jgi:uncharacterized membrane protein YphA (DoxX/SURF4 family)
MDRIVATRAPASIALVRLSVGAVFLSEGVQKLLFPGDPDRGAARFARIGIPWPEFSATFVAGFEIVCGTLILAGLLTRIAAIPLITIMLVAIGTTKVPILLQRGFWDMAHAARTDLAMLLGALFLMLVGAGRLSLDHRIAERPRRHSATETGQ